MRIVIAPDSFKGSLSACEAAEAIDRGIKNAYPEAETVQVPIADGGEGTVDSLVRSTAGTKAQVDVKGPLGQPVRAEYGILPQEQTVIIEMAQASGITLIPKDKRNPLLTSTYGTGQLIRSALDIGYRKFILAVGGSATNDGGAGMLQALGMRLLDANHQEVPAGGGYLHQISVVDDQNFDPRIAESEFLLASDVQNPLLGLHGATHVFGPQKGATPEWVAKLESGMTHWANLIEHKTGIRLHDRPGAGAAGGLAAAFLAFFPCTMKRGIDVVLSYSKINDHLQGAHLVITGEGQIDEQTASGKTPMGIAQAAQQFGIPTIALAGSVGRGIDKLHAFGIAAVFSIVDGPMTLSQAMEQAPSLIERKAEQIMRIMRLNIS